MPKDWHRHFAAGVALTALIVALLSVGPALAQAPTEADIRADMQEDTQVASEALQESGLKRLRDKGRVTIAVTPLTGGKMTARLKGKAFTAAYGVGEFAQAGRYRITLKVTSAGRRYLDAKKTAKLSLKLDFRPTPQPAPTP